MNTKFWGSLGDREGVWKGEIISEIRKRNLWFYTGCMDGTKVLILL